MTPAEHIARAMDITKAQLFKENLMPNHITNILHAPKAVIDSMKSKDREFAFNVIYRGEMPDHMERNAAGELVYKEGD